MEEYQTYTLNDLYLDPVNSPTREWYQLTYKEKINIHWGQRKLLLVLLEFINIFWDPVKVPKPKFVYAGAASGENIKLVSMLYPEIEFHLYDPGRFKIEPTNKLHLYNVPFTNDIAKEWAGRNDVYFISDIRTITLKKGMNLDHHEEIILKDMNTQMEWYNIIKPVYGQLKFRLPFTGGNRPTKIPYLYGYIFKQPWAPPTSIESRIVPIPKYGKVIWDTATYQNQMFYHNTMVRSKIQYLNPFDRTENPIDPPELLNDWDSTTEAVIISSYLKKRSSSHTAGYVKTLSKLFTSKLNENIKYKQKLSNKRSRVRGESRENRRTRDDMTRN